MGFIGFLVLAFLSFYIPEWVGALLAVLGMAITIVHFIFRLVKREKLEILRTIGTLVFCVFFIWLMIR
jgi:hypothetical protein